MLMNEQKTKLEIDLRDYCKHTIENFSSSIESRFEILNADLNAVRISNGKYHVEAMNNVKDIKKDIEIFKQDKSDVYSFWDSQKEIIKISNNEFEGVKTEIISKEKELEILTEKNEAEILKLKKEIETINKNAVNQKA